jgi:hypothetical protein
MANLDEKQMHDAVRWEIISPNFAEQVSAELKRLRAIETAARAFVFSDGRSNPPEKYAALKALLERPTPPT